MTREVMVRTYSGNSQQDALVLYAQDAPAQAEDGWIPVSQTWAQGEWPGAAYLAATFLIIVGIGILLLILMAMYKPTRTLVVTYSRDEGAPPSE